MPNEMRVSKRPLSRYGAVMGVCVLTGLVAGTVTGVASAVFGDNSLTGVLIIAATVAIAMGVGLWACMRWWRGLDEAAQEAHKWAWWWGSTLGLCAAAIVLFTWVSMFESTLAGEPADLFLGGAMVVILCQSLGYGIAWALWWLRRR